MRPHPDKKIYTLRHFLFYLGVAMLFGALTGAAKELLHLSNGLAFAVGLVAGTIIATMALREDLFERPHPSASRKPWRQLL
jgi:putative flippase GtrA